MTPCVFFHVQTDILLNLFQTVDKLEIANAAEELTKEWAHLAASAQKLPNCANSSTNSFVLAALLLGFRTASSTSPSSSPLTHLSNALLSISETNNFADIAHWCHLLSRRRDIATQVIVIVVQHPHLFVMVTSYSPTTQLFDHLRQLLGSSLARPPASPTSLPSPLPSQSIRYLPSSSWPECIGPLMLILHTLFFPAALPG